MFNFKTERLKFAHIFWPVEQNGMRTIVFAKGHFTLYLVI